MIEAAPRVLVAGVTTRPLALSAAQAGWTVIAADAFGDLDLRAAAEVLVPRDADGLFSPAATAEASRGIAAGHVAYTSNFENYPDAVTALARGRRLLGNPASVLRRVRDPLLLARTLRRLGFAAPRVRASAPREPLDRRRRWLLKPRRSGGGHGTSAWRSGRAVLRHQYLQERIAGVPGSVVFLADGRRARVLGLSRQLVGRRAFGASGFRYCGSLMGPGLFRAEARLRSRTEALTDAVVRTFGLVGLNGIDFIARAGVPWPIEVNPRFSGSMELLERGAGLPLFALHAEACSGRLPAGPVPDFERVHGKAIVFARADVLLGATHHWLRDPSLADIPHQGQQIARGRPICTVFGSARDPEGCLRSLGDMADAVYRTVEPVARGAA